MKETLQFLRKSHRYSQTELAAHLGISRQMYIKYENGEVEPSVSIVKKLCELYKVDYETIIDDKHKRVECEYKIPPVKPLVFSEPTGSQLLTSVNYKMALSYIQLLKYEELFKMLSNIVRLLELKKEQTKIPEMTQEESLEILEQMSGCIKTDYSGKDYREMYYEYLDERYGNGSKSSI